MSKQIGVLVVVAVISVAFWFVADGWIANPTFSADAAHGLVWPLVALVMCAALIAIALALLYESPLQWGVIALPAVAYIPLVGFSPYHFTVGAVMAIFLFFAGRNIKKELAARVTIDAHGIVKAGLGMILTALMVGVAFGYSLTPSVQQSARTGTLPSFITVAVQEAARLSVNLIGNVPVSERAGIERQIAKQVLGQVTTLVRPFIQYIPSILAFGLLLLLQGFNFIFYWLASWISMGLFSALKAIKFIRIEEKNIKGEMLKI